MTLGSRTASETLQRQLPVDAGLCFDFERHRSGTGLRCPQFRDGNQASDDRKWDRRRGRIRVQQLLLHRAEKLSHRVGRCGPQELTRRDVIISS